MSIYESLGFYNIQTDRQKNTDIIKRSNIVIGNILYRYTLKGLPRLLLHLIHTILVATKLQYPSSLWVVGIIKYIQSSEIIKC